jgi:hypothetical protein
LIIDDNGWFNECMQHSLTKSGDTHITTNSLECEQHGDKVFEVFMVVSDVTASAGVNYPSVVWSVAKLGFRLLVDSCEAKILCKIGLYAAR